MFPSVHEIKKLREKVGWSQVELAKRADVSQSAITKYENGTQIPSYEIATRIFTVLLEKENQLDLNVSEIMATNVKTIGPRSQFKEVLEIMKKYSISQIPVVHGRRILGCITETTALNVIERYRNLEVLKEEYVENLMEEPLPTVPRSAKLKEIAPLLRHYNAVLVVDRGEIVGIVTKADLLNF